MCLRFQFCTHQRVCILHFLKKSQIRCSLLCIDHCTVCILKFWMFTCYHAPPPHEHLKVHWVKNHCMLIGRLCLACGEDLEKRGLPGGFAGPTPLVGYCLVPGRPETVSGILPSSVPDPWQFRVSDPDPYPDPHGSALIWVAGSGSAFKLRILIRIQEGRNDPQK
jgi:hypothetical protein